MPKSYATKEILEAFNLEAFKTYHATAELTDVTDPHLVYNLRAKLDAARHYDDFEIDRVVAVELKPNAKQSELVDAVKPGRLQQEVQGGSSGSEARPGAEGQSRHRDRSERTECLAALSIRQTPSPFAFCWPFSTGSLRNRRLLSTFVRAPTPNHPECQRNLELRPLQRRTSIRRSTTAVKMASSSRTVARV